MMRFNIVPKIIVDYSFKTKIVVLIVNVLNYARC